MRIGFIGLGIATLFLIGCTSHPEHMRQSRYEVDSDYMSKVERQARMGGMSNVEVYWVNPPRKEKRLNTEDN
jgi:starvation-inducible outer membrane lipoprotein